MTILQLISSGGFYGAEAMLVSLAESLAQLGCDSKVAVLADRREPHTEVADAARERGLDVHILPCAGRWDATLPGRLRRTLRDGGVQVLHCHGYKADLYALASGWAAAWRGRSSLVSTCHNWPNPKKRMQTYAILDRLALRRFDCVTTPSREVAQILHASGLARERVHYIPNGVAVGRFAGARAALRSELGCGAAPLVGFVGRLVAGKGGSDLILAARSVLSKIPSARFVFAGEGPLLEDWRRLAAETGSGGSFHFLGRREDMPSFYASLDVLALPSYNEAMPMCLLEGMAAGVPVVAAPVGAVPEVVSDAETGLLVNAGDVDGLAQAVTRLLEEPLWARRLGQSGKERVEQKYSSESMAWRYLGLYQQAARRRAAPRLEDWPKRAF